jgi:hypothetical protein
MGRPCASNQAIQWYVLSTVVVKYIFLIVGDFQIIPMLVIPALSDSKMRRKNENLLRKKRKKMQQKLL